MCVLRLSSAHRSVGTVEVSCRRVRGTMRAGRLQARRGFSRIASTVLRAVQDPTKRSALRVIASVLLPTVGNQLPKTQERAPLRTSHHVLLTDREWQA